MNGAGRFVSYDQTMDHLFDGFQAGNQGSNTTTSKNQQQRTSPFPFMNNNHRGNGGGPLDQDYDPTGLLAGASSPYNSAAAALGNAGAQLIANTIPGYGLYRPSAPNPALIQNNLQNNLQHHQAVFHHHQQQQQQQHRQRQQHQAAALISSDFDPGLAQQLRGAAAAAAVSSSSRNPRGLGSNSSVLQVPQNIFSGADFGDVSASMVGSSREIVSKPKPLTPPPPPEWLKDLKIEVSGLCLEPMEGVEVMDRIEKKTSDVIKRYLPCVDFLVACQQDLRKGLILATQKRLIRRAYRDSMTPRQFHSKYIAPLADRFLISNQRIMEPNHLTEAYNEVKKLSAQASAVERQGSEVMKNTFLGGMKDGESWGLRKWLSKHGGALQICTDLELILSACQKLNKELDSTKKLAAMMRPLAKRSHERLKQDVPQSYQEISTAHPYLPFFHRLEAALRSMSAFDPEDDDVICLDDSDDDEVEEVVKPAARKRPPTGGNSAEQNRKRQRPENIAAPARKVEPVARHAAGSDDDSDSDIEVVGVKPAGGKIGEPDEDEEEEQQRQDDDDENDEQESQTGQPKAAEWTCNSCQEENEPTSTMCCGCGMSKDFGDGLMQLPNFEDVMNIKTGLSDDEGSVARGYDFASGSHSPLPRSRGHSPIPRSRGHSPVTARKTTPAPNGGHMNAAKLSQDIDALADVFEIGRQGSIRPSNAPVQPDSFWEGVQYCKALRLFAQILRMPEAVRSVNPVDDTGRHPPYHSVIKNPLCFRDIVYSLIPENFNNLEFNSGRDGTLSQEGLSFWNMWCGQDLLQAIDLVFLNTLAYGKISEQGRTSQRTETNRMRKTLWNGIQDIISQKVGSSKELQKQHAPTRRGETSGFVIHKSRNR